MTGKQDKTMPNRAKNNRTIFITTTTIFILKLRAIEQEGRKKKGSQRQNTVNQTILIST